jgi:hypothetical protein
VLTFGGVFTETVRRGGRMLLRRPLGENGDLSPEFFNLPFSFLFILSS